MIKILGMDTDGKWHECRQILNTGRMQRSCDEVVTRTIAWARADSPVILLKDVCPKCAPSLALAPRAP